MVRMRSRCYLFLLVVCLTLSYCLTAADSAMSQKHRHRTEIRRKIPDEQRLLTALLDNYHMYSRPVFNASEKVVIKFGLTLVQISDMDEVNQVLTINVWLEQEWEDERLVWNPSDYNGLSTLRIPCEKIWLPDIVLYNSADDFTTGYMKSKAMVTSDGNVFWPPPAKFRSSCKIDITYFPFDDQVCELKFGSWTYDGFQVDITNRSAEVDLTNYVFSGEWELIDVRVRRTEMYYACCVEPFPDVRFTIIIRRKTLYYLFNIIFPCLWLTILSLLGFWLPPDSGEKITLGITVLLAFSVFMLLIAESMPATSEFVPLIGIYLTVTMAMTSLSIILTVFVLQLHHVGPHQKRVPRWIWTLVIDILAPTVCLCHVSQRYRYLGAKLSKSQLNNSLPGHSRNREGDIRMNTLGAETITSCGVRGRGSCNGIIRSGADSTVSGREDIGSSNADRENDCTRAEAFFSDSQQGRGRPQSKGVHRGLGSLVSVAASSGRSLMSGTGHKDDSCDSRASSSSSQCFAKGRPVIPPARRDPQSRPGEYIGNFGIANHPPKPEHASRNSDGGMHEGRLRVSESNVDVWISDYVSGKLVDCPEHPEDVTYPKLHCLKQDRAPEAKLISKDLFLRTDLPQEKFEIQLSGPTYSAGLTEGQTPAISQSSQAQHTASVRYRDSHVHSSAAGIDNHMASGLVGRDYQNEQITQHLQVLVSRDDEDEYHQDVVTEWRVVAHVMDRLLFWLFLIVAIVSSVIILIVKPLTKPETWRND